MNNIHDKVFICPKCANKTLYPVYENNDITGIGYHELCICDECGAELLSEPQYDFTVKFIENAEDPFYSEANMNHLQMSIDQLSQGKENNQSH